MTLGKIFHNSMGNLFVPIGVFVLFASFHFTSCLKDNKDENSEEPPVTYEVLTILKGIEDSIALPGLNQLQLESSELFSLTNNWCKEQLDNKEALEQVENVWKTNHKTWAKLHPLRVGPIRSAEFRLHFWPPRLSQIKKVLNNNAEIDSAYIKTISGAAKGLASFEWLWYQGKEFVVSDSVLLNRRCRYMTELARELKNNGSILMDSWKDEYSQEFLADSTKEKVVLKDIFQGLVTVLEQMKNQKVGKPAGVSLGQSLDTSIVEAPYSNISLELLKNNLNTVQFILEGKGGTQGLVALIPDSENSLKKQLSEQLQITDRRLEDISGTLSEAMANQEGKVKQLHAELDKLLLLVRNEIAVAFGFQITFTDNDGDG